MLNVALWHFARKKKNICEQTRLGKQHKWLDTIIPNRFLYVCINRHVAMDIFMKNQFAHIIQNIYTLIATRSWSIIATEWE